MKEMVENRASTQIMGGGYFKLPTAKFKPKVSVCENSSNMKLVVSSFLLTSILFLLSFTSCSAILDSYRAEDEPSISRINGFNINIRSSGGAGSGAGSRASAVDMTTTTSWNSEAAFNQAVSRFRVQIGDEPERTIKLGDTLTSQKRYPPGANVTVSYTAESDVTYNVTDQPGGNIVAKQTRTMRIASETREINVKPSNTQVAFRIRDTITPSPTPSYTGYKVELRGMRAPTDGSRAANSDEGKEYVYVQKGDPLSEFIVGNFNSVFSTMRGFTGEMDGFAEWTGSEYYITQEDIDNEFIDCDKLVADENIVVGVPLNIDNTHYLQDLTDWELFRLYGANFTRKKNSLYTSEYYKLVPFSAQIKPIYQYVTMKSNKANSSFDVKREIGAKDEIVVNGVIFKLEGDAKKLEDYTDPYDKTATDIDDGQPLFDAINSVVGPYFPQRNYFAGSSLSTPVQGIFNLMQDGGKRQMLVYRPETVEVTFDYSGLTSQQYWKTDGNTEKKINVPVGTIVTKDDIAKLVKAEAKDDYDISYTGDNVTVNTSTNSISIQSANIAATRLCKVTLRYDGALPGLNNSGVKEKVIYVTEDSVINDEILEFLNTECTILDYFNGALQTRYTANLYYRWDETKKQDIIAKEGATVTIPRVLSKATITYELNGNQQNMDFLINSRHINVKVNKQQYLLLDLNNKTLTKQNFPSNVKSQLKDFEEKFTKAFNVNDNSGPELEPARFGAPEKIGSAEFLQATDVDFYNKTNGTYTKFWEDMENGVPVNHVYGVDYARDEHHDKTVYLTYYVYTPTTNKTITTNTGKIKLWEIAGGKVPLTETYKPTVSSFYMAETEITQKQWYEVMNNDGFDTDATKRPNATWGVGNNYPMYFVNWFDAVIFCNKLSEKEGKKPCYYYGDDKNATDYTQWGDGDDKGKIPNLRNDENGVPDQSENVNYDNWNKNIKCNWEANGYRLPTEAEWEYAARGGSVNLFKKYSGTTGKSDEDIDKVAWHTGNSTVVNIDPDNPMSSIMGGGTTSIHAVNTFIKNKNRIKDMSGNVDEWCWDWLGDYDVTAGTDPKGIAYNENAGRVRRGGSIRNYAANCTVTWRANYPMSHRSWSMGLRVVCNGK